MTPNLVLSNSVALQPTFTIPLNSSLNIFSSKHSQSKRAHFEEQFAELSINCVKQSDHCYNAALGIPNRFKCEQTTAKKRETGFNKFRFHPTHHYLNFLSLLCFAVSECGNASFVLALSNLITI